MLKSSGIIHFGQRRMGNVPSLDRVSGDLETQIQPDQQLQIPQQESSPLQEFVSRPRCLQFSSIEGLDKKFPMPQLPQKPHIVQKQADDTPSKYMEKQGRASLAEKPRNLTGLHFNSLRIERQKPSPHFNRISIRSEDFLKVREEGVQEWYDLHEIIGEGSFGIVYRGTCKRTGEDRAVKVLKKERLSGTQKKQFLAQMKLLSKINHPSIVKVYDLFHWQQNYYVVMEMCQGGTLLDYMRKHKKLKERTAKSIMTQLLKAVNYMHSLNIIHRDLKLDNLVCLKREVSSNLDVDDVIIKIIDFGGAVEAKYRVTFKYPIAGTASYMAPQVFDKVLTNKSDMWSCGVILYCLLMGQALFGTGKHNEIKEKVLTKTLTFDHTSMPGLSWQARQVLELMLERNFHIRLSAKETLDSVWFKTSEIKYRKSSANMNIPTKKRSNNLVAVIEAYLAMRRISQKERQELAQLFSEIDGDCNGLIDTKELLECLKKTHTNLSDKEIETIVQEMDIDKSGKIDFNEFLIAMYSRQKLFVREALNEAFDYFDTDRSGFLQCSEILKALRESGTDQVQFFVDQMDQDGDNMVSREQFVNYLTAK